VLRTITCGMGVYDALGGKVVPGASIMGGQMWFVNPTPDTGADGQSWTEIFVSGSANGFVPTCCVN